MSLITAAEARTWMKIPAGGDVDAIIDILVESVSMDCEHHCGGPIAQVSKDLYLTGDGTDIMILPFAPVIGITTFKVEGATTNLVAGWDKDYVLTNKTGIVRLTSGVFPSRPGSVHVAWTAGYATIPADIKVSIMKGVAFNVYAQDKRRQGVRSMADGLGGSTEYIETEYPKDVTDVWNRYRVVSLC